MEANPHPLWQLIEAIPAPVFFKDKGGAYLGCNQAFENYLGIPRERFIGYTVYDIAPPDLAETYFRADQALLNTGGMQIYESSVSNAEGVRRAVIFNKAVFLAADGNPAGLVGVIFDVTEHKLAENPVVGGALDYLQETNRGFAFLKLLAPHLHYALPMPKAVGNNQSNILTLRERQVLEWICRGKSNSEIASILGISRWTVKIHVANVLDKLNASTRGHAAGKAISAGLIDLRGKGKELGKAVPGTAFAPSLQRGDHTTN